MYNSRRLFFSLLSLAIILASTLSMSSCGGSESDPEPKPKALLSKKEIVSFDITGYTTQLNSATRTITVNVPALADVSHLAPVITISEGATISPESGVAQNFSSPVDYTVTAEDQSTLKYTVSINRTYGLKKFRLFNSRFSVPAVIDHTKRELVLDISFRDTRTLMNLEGTINTEGIINTEAELETGYTISPASGSEVDIDDPATQVITSVDGALNYDLIIRNQDNAITHFRLLLPGVTDEFTFATDNKIRVLSTDDISALTADIKFSERASITPSPDLPRNYNSSVTYQVTSETGKKQDYNFSVIKRSIIIPNDNAEGTYKGISNNGTSFLEIYRSISEPVSVRLMSMGNSSFVNCTITKEVFEGKNYMTIFPQSAFPDGTYKLEVTLANGEVILTTAQYRTL